MNNTETPQKTYVKSTQQKHSWWQRLLIAAIVVPLFLLFVHPAPYIILLILLYVLVLQFFYSPRGRFLKLQATLPTSKIRSMAMGLVEVEGKAMMAEPLATRIKARDCIGYIYTIENITKNNQGKYTYTTVSEETVCNPFYIEDDTGKVCVDPTGIELVWIPLTDQYTNNRKRYSQYVLNTGDHILLIGKATSRDQVLTIERDSSKGTFALAPASTLKVWNTHKPLRNAFVAFSTVIAFLIALVLVAPMRVENGKVIVSTKDLVFKKVDWKSFMDRKQETLEK